MDGPIVKHKVTVAKLTPATSSRPSSRNSTRGDSSSRPPSPTRSFISTRSPLASTPTTNSVPRPKAKVNSSAIRRTPSSTNAHAETPVRPASPTKLTTSRRDGALSPPTSSVGIGTRRPVTAVRVKASSSVSSQTGAPSPTTSTFKLKSPPQESRTRSLTSSSDTLRPNNINTLESTRKRQGSTAAALHHASSLSSLQPVPPLPSQSSASNNLDENFAAGGSISAPQPIKIRSKLTAMAKTSSDASSPPSEHPTPSIPSSTTASSSTRTSRLDTTRVRSGSISSNISFTARTSSPAPPATAPTSPPTPSTPNHHRRSTSHSHPSTPTAYPITTAVPAANPHRYTAAAASMRASPGLRFSFSAASSPFPSAPPSSLKYTQHPSTDEFRPFAKTPTTSIFHPLPNGRANDGNTLNNVTSSYGTYGRSAGTGVAGSSGTYANPTADPMNIPLSPQSPPVSSLSVSSRSSVSHNGHVHQHDSGDTTSPESSVLSGEIEIERRDGSPAQGFGGLVQDDGSTIVDEEKKVKAEAKSNRKIADLEITNRSLLAINASLEKTKDRQAKEIRELKRKLRESRLILPPRAYREVKSSLDPDEIGDDEEDVDTDISSSSSSSDDDEFHSADEGESVGGRGRTKGKRKGKSDETYRRIKILLENLLENGRQALEKNKEDLMDVKGAAKVLTAEEVESWRGGDLSLTVGDTINAGRLSDLDTLDDDDTNDDDDDDSNNDDQEEQDGDYSDPSSGRRHLTRNYSPTPPSVALRESGPLTSSTSLLSSPKPPPIFITESS